MKTPDNNRIFVGKGDEPVYLLTHYANRHGLIAGATGTGKTVTLQVLAEAFSRRGTPVFMADIKGDLAGISQPGKSRKAFEKRARQIGLEPYGYEHFPVSFWDVYGRKGHPVRTTVSELGPLLLSRMLDLNETQEGVVFAMFKLADDRGLLLLDLKDLRAMLQFMGENARELSLQYGNIPRQSIGAIQRRLLVLEQQGGDSFLGEPALELRDMMRSDEKGRGFINILAADRLMSEPRLYSTFLLWLLSELFEELPEIGDPQQPELVFFFDEAHLLFKDAPRALLEKVEQVVRLIRSKGVGVYFISQNPLDIPDTVLGQLGNRFQHALRAFTPRDQKAVRAAASTFRSNPALDTEQVIKELGVGEALVSTLAEKGTPTPVERTLIRPPASRTGTITRAERTAVMDASDLGERYDNSVDRESAWEMLRAKAQTSDRDGAQPASRGKSSRRGSGRKREGPVEAMLKSIARALGSSLGRSLARGVLGSLRR